MSAHPISIDPVRPIVAIIGRPNVGKSTFFNRISGTRKAITDDRPGVTRDRIHAVAQWLGHRFTLVDTGGYVPGSKDEIEGSIRRQAEHALEAADIVLFMCEASTGVTGDDREVADLLRRRDTPCLLVVNKVDHPEIERYDLGEFYALGLGEPHVVSAANGRRSGDLLDALVAHFVQLEAAPPPEEEAVRVVLAGRPNVGKSTLINRLAGQEVSIVHDVPGTTRDATDVTLDCGGRRFVLVDTAGMRRRSKIDDQVEYYSTLRASYSIERCDVVIVLVDAIEGATAQDARIMGHAMELGKGLVVAVNKWDLMAAKQDRVGIDTYRDDLRHRYPFLLPYPILVLSALTGSRTSRCFDEAARVHDRAHIRIPTSRLNRWVEEATKRLPPTGAGREIRIHYVTQSAVSPPTFLVFATRPDLVGESYRRHLERSLRETFDFAGTPVRLHWRHSRSRRGNGTRASR
ncbi:MAG TPA: ribosome biogenesis GTPase Der [Candidatus Latescibacteria bacterium]|nr:ribosome biogenesis GTPase Der [Candidatus Latescibacterota bacterium]|tara:strand:+ start:1730 stop:3112 length:1383 start_codon:yes stop_codon:yes gene_type:complete